MNKKILLVEDDSAILDIYKTVLEKAHFLVETSDSGAEAMKKLREAAATGAPVDLVILDLILPDMNGADVLKEIKKDAAIKDSIVFIMTNQEPSADQPITPKPDQYIIKANITPTQLADLIKKHLKK